MTTQLKTNFDLLLEVLRLEKDECANKFKLIVSELNNINERIGSIKLCIMQIEKELRDVSESVAKKLDIGTYELLHNNIKDLDEQLNNCLEEERTIKLKYEKISQELKEKIQAVDVVTDKQMDEVSQILDKFRKYEESELDFLWNQRNRVTEYV